MTFPAKIFLALFLVCCSTIADASADKEIVCPPGTEPFPPQPQPVHDDSLEYRSCRKPKSKSPKRIVFHGPFKSWYSSGQKHSEGGYVDGMEDGTFTFWHKNGQVMGLVEFKNGEKVSEKWWKYDGTVVASREEAEKHKPPVDVSGCELPKWTDLTAHDVFSFESAPTLVREGKFENGKIKIYRVGTVKAPKCKGGVLLNLSYDIEVACDKGSGPLPQVYADGSDYYETDISYDADQILSRGSVNRCVKVQAAFFHQSKSLFPAETVD